MLIAPIINYIVLYEYDACIYYIIFYIINSLIIEHIYKYIPYIDVQATSAEKQQIIIF